MEKYKEIVDSVLNNPSQFKRLKGHNNKNYIYYSNASRYIIRMNDSSTEKVDFGMIPESKVLLFLTEQGFPAPQLLYYDLEKNVLLLTYQEGKTLSELFGPQGSIPDHIVIGIAKEMKRLHGIGYPKIKFSKSYPTSPNTIGFYQSYHFSTEKMYSTLNRKYSCLFKALAFPNDPFELLHDDIWALEPRNFTLCHCDIHRHNVILTPNDNIYFIDWELSAIGDPLYDIAVHFQKTRYTAEQEKMFLQHYTEGQECEKVINQVQIYRRLETVKYAITDGVRIMECIRDDSSTSDITDMIMRYQHKLELAYKLWNHDAIPNTEELSDILNSCYSKSMI